MSFNLDQFQRAQYVARTEKVDVKPLAEFFGEGEEPFFTVRALTASELQRALEASSKQASVDSVVKAIASSKDQIDAIRKAIGITNETPGEIAKRIEMLVFACVEPKLNHADAAKLAENFPIEFFDVTNRIVALTGMGNVNSKSLPSSNQSQT